MGKWEWRAFFPLDGASAGVAPILVPPSVAHEAREDVYLASGPDVGARAAGYLACFASPTRRPGPTVPATAGLKHRGGSKVEAKLLKDRTSKLRVEKWKKHAVEEVAHLDAAVPHALRLVSDSSGFAGDAKAVGVHMQKAKKARSRPAGFLARWR